MWETSNKSLDRSADSLFLNLVRAAKIEGNRATRSAQTLGDSRKVSQASSQDSDSNALQSETGGPGSISRLC